jgi:hypothetical protein
MIRRMILSAAAGVAAIAGLGLAPSAAEAHPYAPAPICRPVHVIQHRYHRPIAVRRYVPVRTVVVVPAPICPTPTVVVPCR